MFGVKLYPAGATTNSQDGVTDLFGKCLPVLEQMVEHNMPLLVMISLIITRLLKECSTRIRVYKALCCFYVLSGSRRGHGSRGRCIRSRKGVHRHDIAATDREASAPESCDGAHNYRRRRWLCRVLQRRFVFIESVVVFCGFSFRRLCFSAALVIII